jgi:hypothetical protein
MAKKKGVTGRVLRDPRGSLYHRGRLVKLFLSPCKRMSLLGAGSERMPQDEEDKTVTSFSAQGRYYRNDDLVVFAD